MLQGDCFLHHCHHAHLLPYLSFVSVTLLTFYFCHTILHLKLLFSNQNYRAFYDVVSTEHKIKYVIKKKMKLKEANQDRNQKFSMGVTVADKKAKCPNLSVLPTFRHEDLSNGWLGCVVGAWKPHSSASRTILHSQASRC